MQLTPRYGDRPLIALAGDPTTVLDPLTRQRRRLEALLVGLTDDEWGATTRCDGWTVRDVVSHLDTVNGFWAYSVRSGLAGAPSRVLAGFDPAATPAQLVDAARGQDAATTLASFQRSNADLLDLLGSLDADDWTATAEAPPGHQSVSALAHHALWDAWVHERDVLLPAGRDQELEPDEVAACLRYAAALAPALALSLGRGAPGRLALVAADPAVELTVEVSDQVCVDDGVTVGDPLLEGDAVDLVEALSVRAPWPHDLPADVRRMVEGLAVAFDVERVDVTPPGGG